MEIITVKAPSGVYRGFIERDMEIYRSIPYGLCSRWELAAAPEYGEFDCTGPFIDPMQIGGDHAMQSEDVVTLAVYAAPGGAKNRPVLVHTPLGGGVKCMGSGIDPADFVTRNPDIIFVEVNCRTGILCSLNLSEFEGYDEKYKYSNNLAKTDLILALKWVHDNISAFGGDPDNVTVTGHSAGSVTVSALALIPEAWPYFKKLIPRSAFAIDSTVLMSEETSLHIARIFRELTGITSVGELLSASSEQMLEYQKLLSSVKPCVAGHPDKKVDALAFTPCYGMVMDSVLVPANYTDTLRQCAKLKKIMVGCTSGEFDAAQSADPEEMKASLLSHHGEKFDPELGGTADFEKFVAGYIKNGEAAGRSEKYSLWDIRNDLSMRTGAVELASIFAQGEGAYLWYYNVWPENENGYRSPHGASEGAIYGRPASPLTRSPGMSLPEDIRLAVQAGVACFVRSGDPNDGNSVHAALGIDWKPYNKDERWTMVYDNDGVHVVPGVNNADTDLFLPITKEYEAFRDAFDKTK